mmetsp:Transcript_17392/g.30001  ORF Transcript_17392/g.30001 Transcript_17392/m.30001 type:complete len:109 (-) Transcript_17392:712-1038(-)
MAAALSAAGWVSLQRTTDQLMPRVVTAVASSLDFGQTMLMGKGDRRTRRGKIFQGTWGKFRMRKPWKKYQDPFADGPVPKINPIDFTVAKEEPPVEKDELPLEEDERV